PLDLLEHPVVDHRGLGEAHPAVHHTVTDRGQFGDSRPRPSAASSSAIAFRAASWSATWPVRSRVPPPAASGVCRTSEVRSPIRSIRPVASRLLSSMSSSWYFTEEEPELRTRTRVGAPAGTPAGTRVGLLTGRLPVRSGPGRRPGR